MEWFVHSPGAEAPIGPLSTDLIVRGIQAGRVPLDAMVRAADSNEWQPLTRVPYFGAVALGVEPAAPVPQVTSQPAAQSQNAGCGTIVAVLALSTGVIVSGLIGLALWETRKPPATARIDAPSDAPAAPPPTWTPGSPGLGRMGSTGGSPDKERELENIWTAYEALPEKQRTKERLSKSLEETTRVAESTPVEDRSRIALMGMKRARKHVVKTLNRASVAAGPENEILVPSPDPAACLIWGSQWSKGDTAQTLGTMGFEKIQCADGHTWDL